jgi:hypothetical protein
MAGLAAASLFAGCANAKHTMMGVDVGVMAAGAALRIATDPSNCGPDPSFNCVAYGIEGYYAGYTMLAVGALLLLGTAVLWQDSNESAKVEPVATAAPAVTTTTTDIVVLARRASIAARAGHCYEVHQLADSIDKLDRDYRERELLHDTAIALCLD